MRPLNLDNSPCTPTSSNCVIWSGPSLGCINLCTGDTISDVVAKLATELCTILDTLNVSNYDLACLNLNTCAPSDFEQLIQLLIDKVCALENIPVDPANPPSTGCPTNCIVSTKGCLIGPNEPDGEDTLINYIQAIATRVCSLISEIDVINFSIDTINIKILELEAEIADFPVYELPTVSSTCTIDGITSGLLDVMFEALLVDWCALISATGSPSEIAASVTSPCTLADNPYFGPITGLINPVTNLADAISNIWTSLCFLYDFDYKQSIVTGTGDIIVTVLPDTPTTNVTTYEVGLAPTVGVPIGTVVPWAGTGAAPIGWLFCDGGNYSSLPASPYLQLFGVISTTYGGGAGGFLVPNLENRIPVGQGTNSGGYDLTGLGNTGGTRTHTLTDAEIPPHTHGLATATVGGTITAPVTATITGTASGTTDGNYADLTTATDASADETRIRVGAENNLTVDDHRQQTTHTHTFTGTVSGTATGTATGPFTGTIGGDTDDGSPGLQGQAHGNMQPYLVMRYIIKYQ